MQNDCIQLYSSETQELQKYDTDEFPSFGGTHQFFCEKKNYSGEKCFEESLPSLTAIVFQFEG